MKYELGFKCIVLPCSCGVSGMVLTVWLRKSEGVEGGEVAGTDRSESISWICRLCSSGC